MFGLFSWFKKPTEEELELVKAIKFYKTMRIEGERGISVDPAEITGSQEYKDAMRQISKAVLN